MKQTPKSKLKSDASRIEDKVLLLINDDYNTFDYVIDCLVSLCDHDPIQAEQCALLTHYKGSCELLAGEYIDLQLIKNDLDIYGLNVDIV